MQANYTLGGINYVKGDEFDRSMPNPSIDGRSLSFLPATGLPRSQLTGKWVSEAALSQAFPPGGEGQAPQLQPPTRTAALISLGMGLNHPLNVWLLL